MGIACPLGTLPKARLPHEGQVRAGVSASAPQENELPEAFHSWQVEPTTQPKLCCCPAQTLGLMSASPKPLHVLLAHLFP